MSQAPQDQGRPSEPLEAYEAPGVVMIGSLEDLTRGSQSEGTDTGSVSVI
jgi:hypothetical protein